MTPSVEKFRILIKNVQPGMLQSEAWHISKYMSWRFYIDNVNSITTTWVFFFSPIENRVSDNRFWLLYPADMIFVFRFLFCLFLTTLEGLEYLVQPKYLTINSKDSHQILNINQDFKKINYHVTTINIAYWSWSI